MRRRTGVIIAVSLAALVTITGVMATHFYSQQDAAIVKKLYQPYLPSENESIVVICFDDGWKTQLNASEVLDTFGFKATFGIVTSYVGCPAYMSWEEIQALNAKGNDIESHSYSHIDLANASETNIEYELSRSKVDLFNKGIDSSVFIYPFGTGSDNVTVRAYVQKYYLVARALEDADYLDLAEFDRWSIPAFPILNSTSLDGFENIVDNAGGTTVAVLVYHQIGTAGEYSITQSDFAVQMAYLKSENFTVMTLSQLFIEMKV
jgi:peptidoglycan/xylan/chitin deacetylase (PgdA/CDA1 family)